MTEIEPPPSRPALPPDWTPRFYEDSDAPNVVALLDAAFDGWPKVDVSVPAIDHFRWKISSHPGAAPLSLVAEVDGRIVGLQTYVMPLIKAGPYELLAKQGVDFCVHPDYQRLGIRTRLRAMAKDNARRNYHAYFTTGSGHPANRHIERRIGKAKEARLANRVEAWVRSSAAPVARPSMPNGWNIRHADRFDERADGLWAAASEPFELAVVRRGDYLNWRYADDRGGRFEIQFAEQGEALLGYVVLRMSFGKGYVVDLFALPERLDVVSSLIGQGVAWLSSRGASTMECWLPGRHPYWRILRDYGFLHRRKTVNFSVRPALEYESVYEMAFVHNPEAALHVTMGDCDLI